ncbi:hypothetical protein PIB30_085443 [Stylosanthes scabra]|uniref:Uncharacterized protein n=1 Tax=Stylosanthes scabra TaxID=79078 RepID=A0ABU6UTM8_9FABA|nr:hypothetical protein [Stylosanthes scabra]
MRCAYAPNTMVCSHPWHAKVSRRDTQVRTHPCYGSQRTFPSAKEKAKVYGPPTRASPWLVAMRARLAANSHRATRDAHAIPAPPIARRTARISVKYFEKLAERDGPFTAANSAPIEIDSDLEEEDPEMDPEDEQHEEADPAKDPRDEHEEEEDPKIDIEEEQEADP